MKTFAGCFNASVLCLLCLTGLSACQTLELFSLKNTGKQGDAASTRVSPQLGRQQHAQRLLAQAMEWQRKAASVGGEWRDVQPLIDQAGEAMHQGEYVLAAELAEQALFQAKSGYEQMESQKAVANPAYLFF